MSLQELVLFGGLRACVSALCLDSPDGWIWGRLHRCWGESLPQPSQGGSGVVPVLGNAAHLPVGEGCSHTENTFDYFFDAANSGLDV